MVWSPPILSVMSSVQSPWEPPCCFILSGCAKLALTALEYACQLDSSALELIGLERLLGAAVVPVEDTVDTEAVYL